MRVARRRLIGAAFLATLTLGGACQNLPAGPSLSNLAVSSLAWRSTSGDANLCCCRVTGRATNNNSVAVHVTLKFSGYDGQQASPIATTVYFISGLQPGATHNIDAAGFIVPCSAINSLKYEVELKGLASPPR